MTGMEKSELTPKERFLTVLNGGIPDRLPVTTHEVMPYFLDKYMNGMSDGEFFDHFGLDPVKFVVEHTLGNPENEYFDPDQGETGFLESRRVATDNWRIKTEILDDHEYTTTRYNFITPKKTLSMVLRSNEQTDWVCEHLVKEKSDIDIIGEYVTCPHCDVKEVNQQAIEYGDHGIIRGHVICFDVFGQPGCWQDAACLYGIENLIMAAFDDPEWVHAFLKILLERKKVFVKSFKDARYDIIELGGGDASSTVISPELFDRFVAPYDSELIELAHEAGQRITYHTCGGMMPILDNIADMNPDAMETFTPPEMGGDTNLKEAKERIGHRVCMIGGFDQFHHFINCKPEETRKAVRKCFQDAGRGGGYILTPSDHFFDADIELLKAFADEAKKCTY